MKRYRHLTLADRRMIGIWKKQFVSQAEIARRLGVSPSSISRELKRNRCGFGYCCYIANHQARARRDRANTARRKITPEREAIIRDCLERKFSPEQIAGTFKKLAGISISTVSIYRWIYRYWGGGKDNLRAKLRRKGRGRRKYSLRRARLGNRPMIGERPRSANRRVTYGHWEADLMEGARGSEYVLLILVDRRSRYALIRPLKDQKAATVSTAISSMLAPYKVRTITYDNGSEFAAYKKVSEQTGSKAFFCHPYRAWEKGTIENTIGLLREYFPKRTKLTLPRNRFAICNEIQRELNTRPRKCLRYRRPEDLRKQLVA